MPTDIELMARAVDEIKRLRAHNERLTKAVATAATSHQVPEVEPVAKAADAREHPFTAGIRQHRATAVVGRGMHAATPMAKAIGAREQERPATRPMFQSLRP